MLRYKTETRPGLVALYDMAGQETERVHSYNPGARTGRLSGWTLSPNAQWEPIYHCQFYPRRRRSTAALICISRDSVA